VICLCFRVGASSNARLTTLADFGFGVFHANFCLLSVKAEAINLVGSFADETTLPAGSETPKFQHKKL
jgi:hypothetical protein